MLDSHESRKADFIFMGFFLLMVFIAGYIANQIIAGEDIRIQLSTCKYELRKAQAK